MCVAGPSTRVHDAPIKFLDLPRKTLCPFPRSSLATHLVAIFTHLPPLLYVSPSARPPIPTIPNRSALSPFPPFRLLDQVRRLTCPVRTRQILSLKKIKKWRALVDASTAEAVRGVFASSSSIHSSRSRDRRIGLRFGAHEPFPLHPSLFTLYPPSLSHICDLPLLAFFIFKFLWGC